MSTIDYTNTNKIIVIKQENLQEKENLSTNRTINNAIFKVYKRRRNVVFLKGFAVGITWEENFNQDLKNAFIEFIKLQCKAGQSFIFIWDGDDYGQNSYTHIINSLMDNKDICINCEFIAYRGKGEEESFKTSWGDLVLAKKKNITLIMAPAVNGNRYEDLGVFSRNQTNTALKGYYDKNYNYYFCCFGGGAVLDKEFDVIMDFNATLIFFNITRIKKNNNNNNIIERNSLFYTKENEYIHKDPRPLIDLPTSPFDIEIISVKKDEVPMELMKKRWEELKDSLITKLMELMPIMPIKKSVVETTTRPYLKKGSGRLMNNKKMPNEKKSVVNFKRRMQRSAKKSVRKSKRRMQRSAKKPVRKSKRRMQRSAK
jgi:hypothetical protein